MDPATVAQYGIAAFAVGVLGYVVALLVQRPKDAGDLASELKHVLKTLAQSQQQLAVTLERQTTLLEQQGRMLERVSERLDEVWRAMDNATGR